MGEGLNDARCKRDAKHGLMKGTRANGRGLHGYVTTKGQPRFQQLPTDSSSFLQFLTPARGAAAPWTP
eukprot:15452833-Alexandrium_andersonii.AAC.1